VAPEALLLRHIAPADPATNNQRLNRWGFAGFCGGSSVYAVALALPALLVGAHQQYKQRSPRVRWAREPSNTPSSSNAGEAQRQDVGGVVARIAACYDLVDGDCQDDGDSDESDGEDGDEPDGPDAQGGGQPNGDGTVFEAIVRCVNETRAAFRRAAEGKSVAIRETVESICKNLLCLRPEDRPVDKLLLVKTDIDQSLQTHYSVTLR